MSLGLHKEGKRRAVFFDRDGVILKAVVINGKPRPPYSLAEYTAFSGIVPGAKEVVEEAKTLGFVAILVSNQPDIRYKNISQTEWKLIQDQTKDIPFDDVFICFHGKDDGCECKKPNPVCFLKLQKNGI